MNLTFSDLTALARETLFDPRGSAQRIMALGLPAATGWTALALATVGSALLTHLMLAVDAVQPPDFFVHIMGGPIQTAIVEGAVMAGFVLATHRIGRGLGGDGTLSQALVLTGWLQFLMVAAQSAQLVLLVILPWAAELIGLLAGAAYLWVLTVFVGTMHGYRSLALTFLGVLGAYMLAGFAVGIVLILVLGPPPMGV